MIPILSITGFDNSGFSGLQQDIRILSEMGCHAMTAATCLVTQNAKSIKKIEFLSEERIREQIVDIISDYHPLAVKVGLLGNTDTVITVAKEIIGCKRIVIAPGIVFSNGKQFVHRDTIDAITHYLIPLASIVILRCKEAELMLDMKILTDEDMKRAANALLDMGAKYVLLRGGSICRGRITALLAGKNTEQFFSSYFIEGWLHHGVGGALSAAVAARLGMGDDIPNAICNAHKYVHSRIVYAVTEDEKQLRPADIYNSFMNLIANNYCNAHDVAFYADKLNVSTRYLSIVTSLTVSKSPKQIISEYLLEKSKQMLRNSHMDVKGIAYKLGFNSNPVFCKFFKQHEGKTPGTYRKTIVVF